MSLAALAVALGGCNCGNKVQFGKDKGPKKNKSWAQPKLHDDYKPREGKDAEEDGGEDPPEPDRERPEAPR